MLDTVLDYKTVILLFIISVLVISKIKADFKIKELENVCEGLQKSNKNLCQTFPDIKLFLKDSQQVQKKKMAPSEPTGLQVYRAVRTKGAPDINLGEISEVTIVALNRGTATELMKKIEHFNDDNWWILEDIKEEQVISVKHLGGLGDD